MLEFWLWSENENENGTRLLSENPGKRLWSESQESEKQQLDRRHHELGLDRRQSQSRKMEMDRDCEYERPSWQTSCSWVWLISLVDFLAC